MSAKGVRLYSTGHAARITATHNSSVTNASASLQGPAAAAPPPPKKDDDAEDDSKFDEFMGADTALLAGTTGEYDKDDKEADEIWAHVDDFMDDRRRVRSWLRSGSKCCLPPVLFSALVTTSELIAPLATVSIEISVCLCCAGSEGGTAEGGDRKVPGGEPQDHRAVRRPQAQAGHRQRFGVGGHPRDR